MKFPDAVTDVISDLTTDGSSLDPAISRGLALAIAAWTALADIDPDGGWDLFGLDVCAAAEAIHLALPPAPPIDWSGIDHRSTRRSARRLVEGIAESLEAPIEQPVVDQLEFHAAAAQLRRAGGALR